jgi:hypothetical protein
MLNDVLPSSERDAERWLPPDGARRPEAQVRPLSEPRRYLMAQGSQETLPVLQLLLPQVFPHPGEAEGHGCPGERLIT